MTLERLQKVLARAGVGSRRKVEEMIREGRITIDGRLAQLGDRADLETESVKVDGRRIRPPSEARRYLLLNKPGGYVSTASDPEGRPTVLDLLPQRLRRGLVPVGRLDYATEGLLLLTDDGDFAHHVAHPRFGCWKTYEVKVKGRPAEAALDKLRGGVVLDGKRTAPAEIRERPGHLGPRQSVDNSWWTVVLSEGRTRQIREMFARIGHPVSRLRRVAIGPVSDPRLPRGAWRELTENEVEKLRRKTRRPRKPGAAVPPSSRPKPARSGPARSEPARSKSPRSKSPRSKSARSKSAHPKPARSKPAKSPRSKPARSRPSGPKSKPAKAGRGRDGRRGGTSRGGRRRSRD